MPRPEEPSGESQRREIFRSAVLFESWIGKRNPKVYLLLLHKKGSNWWELPGGNIDREVTKPRDLLIESLRELGEEAPMTNYPISSQSDPLDFRVLGRWNDLTVRDGNTTIYTAIPYLIREQYKTLPRINLSGQHIEHDDYAWVEVGDLYASEKFSPTEYSSAYRRSNMQLRDAISATPQIYSGQINGNVLQ